MPGAMPTSVPLQGGARRFVQTVPLMRNVAGAGSYSLLTSDFRIWIPSTRLQVCATIGFRPDSQEDATIPAGFVATLNAWAKTDRQAGGFAVRGNGILPGPLALSTVLPWTYEAVTGVDEWRGTITAPAGTTGLEVTGTFYLTVSWEPTGGASVVDDDELRRMFDSCKALAGNFPTVFGG
jgi:hypothetical protein